MSATPPRLNLERLDDRLVPACVLNLTTHAASAITPGGALVEQIDDQPTGTGHIRSFVRIQGAAKGGVQHGYNTDGRPLQFDENSSPQFTRSITLGEVPVVTVDGVEYREFLLDINQKASSPYLSVDEVRVYLADAGDRTSLAGLSPAFDLDAGGDVSVRLNANLNSGSGSGDMRLLIPNAAFGGADPGSFLYLYSKMGGVRGAAANGGFEEWAVKPVPPATTPVGTASLSGRAGVFSEDDSTGLKGLPNVTVELRYTNADGVTVVWGTTVTDVDGRFSFNNLPAGTYTVLEKIPSGYEPNVALVGIGTVDGADSGDVWKATEPGFMGYTNILLGEGQTGSDYLFWNSELPVEDPIEP